MMKTSVLLFTMGGTEWLLIALVVLLLFGGKKIPELMKGLGKGINEFKKGNEIICNAQLFKSDNIFVQTSLIDFFGHFAIVSFKILFL